MRRRYFISTVLAILIAGCFGWREETTGGEDQNTPSEEDLKSTPVEDPGIDRPPEQLYLSIDELPGDEWQRNEEVEEGCRKFERTEDAVQITVTSCVDTLADSDEAREQYETAVEQSSKIFGRLLDREPEVGEDAAVIDAVAGIKIVFYDTNVVGSVKYVHSPASDSPLRDSELPNPETAIEYAAVMHQGWRED